MDVLLHSRTLIAICQKRKSSGCGSFLKPVASRRPSFLFERFERLARPKYSRRLWHGLLLPKRLDQEKVVADIKKAPTESGLQVIITFQRGPARPLEAGRATKVQRFRRSVTRSFGRSTNRPSDSGAS